MKFLATTILAALVATGASAGAVDSRSILSLEIGMPFEDAKNFVVNRAPGLRLKEWTSVAPGGQKYTFGMQGQFVAVGNDEAKEFIEQNKFSAERLVFFTTSPLSGQKLMGGSRFLQYDDGTGPDFNELEAALMKRYGKPFLVDKTGNWPAHYYWSTAAKPGKYSCYPESLERFQINPACGMFVHVELRKEKDGLVTWFVTEMMDHDLAASAYDRDKSETDRLAREKVANDRANRAATPQL